MTNEEVMQLMTDMGLHEGGMDDWLVDNAWVMFANAVASAERERCAELRSQLHFFCFDKPSSVGKQELVGLVNQALDDYQKLIRTGNI